MQHESLLFLRKLNSKEPNCKRDHVQCNYAICEDRQKAFRNAFCLSNSVSAFGQMRC